MKSVIRYLVLMLIAVFICHEGVSAQTIAPSGKTSRASSQQIFVFDVQTGGEPVARATALQLTNTNPTQGVYVHVKIYYSTSATERCLELDFVDYFTPLDTHTYFVDDMVSNRYQDFWTFTDSAQTPPDPSKGFIVVTPIRAEDDTRAIAFQHLIGSIRIFSAVSPGNEGPTVDEYYINSMGRDAVDFATNTIVPDGTELDGTAAGFVLVQPEELFFNFNIDDEVSENYTDVILFNFIDEYSDDPTLGYTVKAGETTIRPFIHDDEENRISCSEITNTCLDDFGLGNQISTPANILINDGAGICDENDVEESFFLSDARVGWVRLLVTSPYDPFENQFGIIGYIDNKPAVSSVAGADWMRVDGEESEPVPPVLEEDCEVEGDEDGDGAADCADTDCDAAEGCESGDQCADGEDNDGDGNTDCADGGCVGATGPDGITCEATEATCDDGGDNDGDGLVDCDDSDCAASESCASGGGGDGGGCTVASGSVTTATALANMAVALLPLAGAFGFGVVRRKRNAK